AASIHSSMCFPARTCSTVPCPRSWSARCIAFPCGSRMDGRRVTVTTALDMGGEPGNERKSGSVRHRRRIPVPFAGAAHRPPDGPADAVQKIHRRRDEDAELLEEEHEE